MRVLFLDDSADRIAAAQRMFCEAEFVSVTTTQAAIEQFNRAEPWYLVMLDHDLGAKTVDDQEDCGMRLVAWMIANLPDIQMVIIHSWNIPAAQQMTVMLQAVGYDVLQCPFSPNMFD